MQTVNPKMIGVVGGVGSYAGLDLIRKIYDLSGAQSDPEHLPVVMISEPQKVADRTAYLLGEVEQNPGEAIGLIIQKLATAGAEVVGIPCNSAHAPAIFDAAKQYAPTGCQLLHLIEEVGLALAAEHPQIKRVGVLSTTGTYQANVYPETLAQHGLEVLRPSETTQHERVQPAIYDPTYGVKSIANPVQERASADFRFAARELIDAGAQAIILGCTEIPLALTEPTLNNYPLIDATAILAKALIRASCGE